MDKRLAKVFISCGQSDKYPDEKPTAEKIREYLQSKGFHVYLANDDQKLFDTNQVIIEELESSDYYLFIDFKRENISCSKSRGSLFTNQEFAIALYMNFDKTILLQEEGIEREGFLNYTSLTNIKPFSKKEDVLGMVKEMVESKKWDSNFSRHLIAELIGANQDTYYSDHYGYCNPNPQAKCPLDKYKAKTCSQTVFPCRISNRNPHREARGVRAILKEIKNPGSGRFILHVDGRYLKWAGHKECYEHVIPRNNGRNLDLFCICACAPLEVYLHEDNDAWPKKFVNNKESGELHLTYSIFAEGFPKLEFTIKINLTNDINTTTVELVNKFK